MIVDIINGIIARLAGFIGEFLTNRTKRLNFWAGNIIGFIIVRKAKKFPIFIMFIPTLVINLQRDLNHLSILPLIYDLKHRAIIPATKPILTVHLITNLELKSPLIICSFGEVRCNLLRIPLMCDFLPMTIIQVGNFHILPLTSNNFPSCPAYLIRHGWWLQNINPITNRQIAPKIILMLKVEMWLNKTNTVHNSCDLVGYCFWNKTHQWRTQLSTSRGTLATLPQPPNTSEPSTLSSPTHCLLAWEQHDSWHNVKDILEVTGAN